MKKIIAISVMFALLAGAVFADTSVGGGIETRFTLLEGSNAKPTAPKPKMGGTIATANIQLSGTNADGNLGGTVRIRMEDIVTNSDRAGQSLGSVNLFHKAFVWWKPIPQLRIFLGLEPDGQFGTDVLEGWAYHRGSEGFINNHNWDFWRAVFPGNWDTFGLAISVFPIEGLDINIVIPTGKKAWPYNESREYTNQKWRLDEMFVAGLQLSVNYSISGIGRVMFTYLGANAIANGMQRNFNGYEGFNFDNNDTTKYKAKTNGMFALSFLLTSVEGFQIHVGGSILLANGANWKEPQPDGTWKDAASPTFAGVAVHYAAESFGAKFRALYGMNTLGPDQSIKVGAGGNDLRASNKLSTATFSVMPWFALESLTIFLDIGATMKMIDISGADNTTAWFVNPYITVPISGGKFQAGLKINNNGAKKDPTTTYSIPFLLGFNF